MNKPINRRDFLKAGGALLGASALPISLVELAFADTAQNFSFAYISDAHIQQIKGNKFVRNWDRGLIRAVAETNLLTPKPDFVIFGGDLAQLGNKPELDHGADQGVDLDGAADLDVLQHGGLVLADLLGAGDALLQRHAEFNIELVRDGLRLGHVRGLEVQARLGDDGQRSAHGGTSRVSGRRRRHLIAECVTGR